MKDRSGALRVLGQCSSNTSLRPLYTWVPQGRAGTLGGAAQLEANVTLLASTTRGGTGPSLAVQGPTTRAVIEAYVEKALVPSLSPGQVVVMDNLSAPKGGTVRDLI